MTTQAYLTSSLRESGRPFCHPRNTTMNLNKSAYIKKRCEIVRTDDMSKVEERRDNFSLRKLRKPREREMYSAVFLEISHTKKEKNFLWENWETLEKEKKEM